MIAKLRAGALGLVLLLTTVSVTWATDQNIILELGAGSVLELERPFDIVLIDDASVVDVHRQTDRSVLLEPLKLGTSAIVFLDEKNVVVSNVTITVRTVARTE